MSKVSITRSLLDDLAMSISAKSGEPVPLTLTEMKDAVDGISGGDITVESLSVTSNGTYTAPTGKAYSPVTVSVSGGTPRTSTDLVVSGATVTAPAGVYATDASKSVASGTAGTPTATKGTVSNHSVLVTPSVTNTAGYISGGTINGTAVTVSASELVSGSDTVTTNDTYDVTNLAELIVNVSGSGGLEYETGTLTLSSDASSPIIMFSDTHTDVPCYINIVDTTGTTATSNSCLYWTFMNWYTAFDAIVKTTNSANMYGRYQYGYKSSSGASAGNIDCTNTGSSSGGLYYLVSTDRFGPYCGSGNRYWRSGRMYKWIAVWAPTTT